MDKHRMHNVRVFEKTDYAEICNWHKMRKTPEIELDFIPPFGLICAGFCAGFLYKTDCKVATIGSLISNPKSDKKERSEMLDLIINLLYQKAISDGYKMVTISTNIPKVKDKFKALGFLPGDNMVDIFFRRELCL